MLASGMVLAPGLSMSAPSAAASVGPEEATAYYFRVLQERSPATAQHSERVARYASALGLALDLPLARVLHLERCGLLHDMGKLGVDDAILEKPAALTEDEWRKIKSHPVIGIRILSACPALGEILPAVAYHHERYDGMGYPYGIGGTALPLDVRIITVCDAYDSMTADRPYRRGMPVDEAVRRLRQGAGTQFDPDLVETFVTQVVG